MVTTPDQPAYLCALMTICPDTRLEDDQETAPSWTAWVCVPRPQIAPLIEAFAHLDGLTLAMPALTTPLMLSWAWEALTVYPEDVSPTLDPPLTAQFLEVDHILWTVYGEAPPLIADLHTRPTLPICQPRVEVTVEDVRWSCDGMDGGRVSTMTIPRATLCQWYNDPRGDAWPPMRREEP